jgi:c-di-GMP-binding flagellar brake protein YcgR
VKEDKNKPRPVVERQYERFSYLRDLAISCEGRTEQIKLRTPDISPFGMFVNTDYLFPEDAILLIRFTLPFTRHQVRARGKVRYSLPGVGIGIQFVEISAEDQHAIDKEIYAAACTPEGDDSHQGS